MSSVDYRMLQDEIGYHFNDEALLIHALTHSSYSNEQHTGRVGSNERLEFLGDAVLELVSSEYFYGLYPEMPEGELTKLRASFVCEPALAETAETIPLSRYILLGKGEESTGGRTRPSLISDAFEALIGAVYLDGGFANAKEIILKYILNDVENKRFFYDSKTILQEVIQSGNADKQPVYSLVSEDGPDHMKRFTVSVELDGEVLGTGTATSKKHAEQKAAFEALKKLEKVQECI